MARPNILLITSDQQHYDTLGINNPRIKTPALDRLAREGVVFDRAYCSNPVCSPSRSSIITGLYPAWHHCWTIGVKLPEDVPTVGDILDENGYGTTLIGKAHFQPTASTPESPGIECHPKLRDLDFWRNFNGPWYGFQHVETSRNHTDEHLVGQHYAIWMEENGLKDWQDYFGSWPPDPSAPRQQYSWTLPEEYHYTHWTGERTVANIERHVGEERPFFMWASFHDPHPSYLVSEPWASMYDPQDMQPGEHVEGEFDDMPPHFKMTRQRDADFSAYREEHNSHGFSCHLRDEDELKKCMAVYYGMISFMDSEIGRILDTLDRLGQTENTLVLFSTDHGHFLGHHGLIAKCGFHYEDMLRIPTIARLPGQVPSGRTLSALQSQVDFAPTFLDIAGIDVPGLMQGVSQWDVWRGRADQARDHVIVENRHQPNVLNIRTYVDERYKVTVYRDQEYGEMFDLQEDPGELKNLWDSPEHLPLKCGLLHRFINAELRREPTRMPRIAGA